MSDAMSGGHDGAMDWDGSKAMLKNQTMDATHTTMNTHGPASRNKRICLSRRVIFSVGFTLIPRPKMQTALPSRAPPEKALQLLCPSGVWSRDQRGGRARWRRKSRLFLLRRIGIAAPLRPACHEHFDFGITCQLQSKSLDRGSSPGLSVTHRGLRWHYSPFAE